VTFLPAGIEVLVDTDGVVGADEGGGVAEGDAGLVLKPAGKVTENC